MRIQKSHMGNCCLANLILLVLYKMIQFVSVYVIYIYIYYFLLTLYDCTYSLYSIYTYLPRSVFISIRFWCLKICWHYFILLFLHDTLNYWLIACRSINYLYSDRYTIWFWYFKNPRTYNILYVSRIWITIMRYLL